MAGDRTIHGVARQTGAWRLAGNALALIVLIAAVYAVIWFGAGAIVETQEKRTEVVSDGR